MREIVKNGFRIYFLSFFWAVSTLLIAQDSISGQTYTVTDGGEGVTVTGTSSLHDWEMKLTEMNSSFMLENEGAAISGIRELRFSAKGQDLVNGNNTMDRKAHSALMVKKHPELTFFQDSVSEFKSDESGYSGKVTGRLTIAGVTKKTVVPFKAVIKGDFVIVTGKADLQMSDFDIDPPSALLGTLKTGNEITVTISLTYRIKSNTN